MTNAARSEVSITCTECSGKPATFKPCFTASAIALFDSSASEPPRKIMALPDLIAKDAASSVTFDVIRKSYQRHLEVHAFSQFECLWGDMQDP